MQLEGVVGEISVVLFWKLKKSVLIFWEKCPVSVHLCVKFLIWNAILRVSRRKNSDIFPCRAYLSCVVNDMLVEFPLFQETFPALINSWLRSLLIRVTKIRNLQIQSPISNWMQKIIRTCQYNFTTYCQIPKKFSANYTHAN